MTVNSEKIINAPIRQPELTIFIDGLCPLCAKEMEHLKALDGRGRIRLVDITTDEFYKFHPEIDAVEAMSVLHAKSSNGDLLLGLDITHKAWSLVGKGSLVAPLRWPVIKWFAGFSYRFFARHRHTISKLLTGKARLDECDRCFIAPEDRDAR